jgi:hypothetical protein
MARLCKRHADTRPSTAKLAARAGLEKISLARLVAAISTILDGIARVGKSAGAPSLPKIA